MITDQLIKVIRVTYPLHFHLIIIARISAVKIRQFVLHEKQFSVKVLNLQGTGERAGVELIYHNFTSVNLASLQCETENRPL